MRVISERHEDHKSRDNSSFAIPGYIPGDGVFIGRQHAVDQSRKQFLTGEVFSSLGRHYKLDFSHECNPRNFFFGDKPQNPEIFGLMPFRVGLQYFRDGDQMRTVLVSICLVIIGNRCIGFVSLNDVGVFHEDLFLLGDYGVEGLVEIVLLKGFQSFSPHHFKALDFDGQIWSDGQLSFEDSDWVDFSLSEPPIEVDCDLIRDDHDVIFCLCLEVHQKLSVADLLFVFDLSLDLVVLDIVPLHEVDGNDVQLYIALPQLRSQLVLDMVLVESSRAHSVGEEKHLFASLATFAVPV